MSIEPFELVHLNGMASAGWNDNGTRITITLTSSEPWNRAYSFSVDTSWLSDVVKKAEKHGSD